MTFLFFWSLDQLVVETLGVTSVCLFVHPLVRLSVRHAFSRKPFITFSETLQLVTACKREKNVPSAFLIIFTVLAILAKNWSNLAIWLDVWKTHFKGWKSLKNLKVSVFETDFKQLPFVFWQTTCTYS